MRAHVRECLCDCLLAQTIRRRLNENVSYKPSNSCNIQIFCLSLFTPPVPLPPAVCCLSLFTPPVPLPPLSVVCLFTPPVPLPPAVCLFTPPVPLPPAVCCLSLFTPPVPLPPAVCCLSLYTTRSSATGCCLYTTRSSSTVCCLSLLTQSVSSRDNSKWDKLPTARRKH